MKAWPGLWRRRWPGVLAASAVALGVAFCILVFPSTTQPLRERLFDLMIGGRAEPRSGRVWVVEVGAVNKVGAPWGRNDLARLVAALAAEDPAVNGLDIVLSLSCEPSVVNSALTAAISRAPVLTGFLVPGPMGLLPVAEAPLGVMQNAPAWDAKGAEAACGMFQMASAGVALVSLSGGRDGRVRLQCSWRANPIQEWLSNWHGAARAGHLQSLARGSGLVAAGGGDNSVGPARPVSVCPDAPSGSGGANRRGGQGSGRGHARTAAKRCHPDRIVPA